MDDLSKPFVESLRVMDDTLLLAALSCPRRFYFEANRQEADSLLARCQQPDLERLAVLSRAAEMLPGVRVPEIFLSREERAVRTMAWLGEPDADVLFGGCIMASGLAAGMDMLISGGTRGVDLFLFREGPRPKQHHLVRLAFCRFVAEMAGIHVSHAGLACPNPDFVRPGGPAGSVIGRMSEASLDNLLAFEDLTGRTADLLEQMPDMLDRLRRLAESGLPPDTGPGEHCRKPLACPFHGTCHPPDSGDRVSAFYRMSRKRKAELQARGITGIRDIPDSERLTPLQKRIRDVHRTGVPYISPRFSACLRSLPGPVHYLDFETICPALPFYPGTRPFQTIPFQFSLHIDDGEQGLAQASFLAERRDDPRPALIRSLLANVRPEGVIFSYTRYENQVISELAAAFPEFRASLTALAGRLVDMCDLVRKYLYHPGFRQSFSLKKVLPALVPDMDYGGLDVGDGLAAVRAFMAMCCCRNPADREAVRQALLEYCGRDTLALHVIRTYVLFQDDSGDSSGTGPLPVQARLPLDG